ncbi:cytochrome P450 [Kribbella shirazensis]|uniref:Cytochrome P450 n=1 Tax=Kribbella shirazensis TaxID=1105143 RepID=A0A7X5V9U5_9ACTN|nr:cytochrome P450 [Kribbella shirazensis]NIK56602.1 cytochrome P450 [Kribbella shirazensis]
MSGCPARYDEELGYWVVDDPALAREVLLDPRTFRPDNAVLAHTPLSVKALRVLSGVGFAVPPTLANNAGESHRPIRAAVARFFSPARVAAVEPLARELNTARVASASAALAAGEQVDLVQAIAAEPPALVVLHLLGLTDVDVPALKAWSLDSLELFWGRPDEDRQLELAHRAAEFYGWLRSRTTAARQAPADDLFGVLVGLGLSDEEVCAVGYFLLIAGQETTTQLISTAFHRSLGTLIEPAEVVEEVLRDASSVPTWRRITAEPTTLGDVDLPAQAPVLLGLTGHGGPADLAFGIGIHRCLGAGLARLETRVALECAQELLTDVRLTEVPPMIDLLSFRAPKRLLLVTRGNTPDNARGYRPAV